jgi:hypothetical protein
LVIGAPAGVYLFDGQTITPFSEGGIDTVWDIAADQTMLYAATTKGVWRRPLSQLTPGSVAATASPNEIAVVPNPISDEAGISFGDAPASGSVRIFNTLGNEVARYDVTNDRELRIDLRALPSGCYTVMWNDGTRTLTRSVVKLTR